MNPRSNPTPLQKALPVKGCPIGPWQGQKERLFRREVCLRTSLRDSISIEIPTHWIKVQFLKLGPKKYPGRNELCGQILKKIENSILLSEIHIPKRKKKDTAKTKNKKQPV